MMIPNMRLREECELLSICELREMNTDQLLEYMNDWGWTFCVFADSFKHTFYGVLDLNSDSISDALNDGEYIATGLTSKEALLNTIVLKELYLTKF